MIQGSFYLLRRKCGKPNCRCAAGKLHASYVSTRSEAGHDRIFTVPKDQRAQVRPAAAAYRRYQRARGLSGAKQDCERKAFDRLAVHLKAAWPQLRLCLNFDNLHCCGRVFALCREHGWHFVVTFKPGRTPELWQEFEALLQLSPHQKRTTTLPDKTRRVYRWVAQLPCLLQIGHRLMQLLSHNSLHQALAKTYGHHSVRALWGALKKIPQRLLDAFRYYLLPEADFDVQAAARCHISLNSS
jgi:hypothetical protein